MSLTFSSVKTDGLFIYLFIFLGFGSFFFHFNELVNVILWFLNEFTKNVYVYIYQNSQKIFNLNLFLLSEQRV